MSVLLAIDPSTKEMGWAIFDGKAKPRSVRSDNDAKKATPSGTGLAASGSCRTAWELVESGVIVAQSRAHPREVSERIEVIQHELDKIAKTWDPQDVACGKRSLIQLPAQQMWMDMLAQALEQWANMRKLALRCYNLKDIRASVVGRTNVAKEELNYAMMTRWGLLGQGKTTQEWNAIAVGDYHIECSESQKDDAIRATPHG